MLTAEFLLRLSSYLSPLDGQSTTPFARMFSKYQGMLPNGTEDTGEVAPWGARVTPTHRPFFRPKGFGCGPIKNRPVTRSKEGEGVDDMASSKRRAHRSSFRLGFPPIQEDTSAIVRYDRPADTGYGPYQ